MAHVVAYELVALVRASTSAATPPRRGQVFTSLLVKLHQRKSEKKEDRQLGDSEKERERKIKKKWTKKSEERGNVGE
mgnify:CR=1 FL=1